jgi:acyl-CoA thioester hydrolase
MIVFETKIVVLYADTDKMGYVYYGNYPRYLERARTEALKSIGFSYKALEEKGYGMPVINLNIKYLKPAFYDDILTIKTIIRNKPNRKMLFEYEIYNQDNVLINIASTELILVSLETKKTVQAPVWFDETFQKYFIE